MVLTWYNALSALGYNPFLDRLSLDAVENIPQYVRETVTFAIAVTAGHNLAPSARIAIPGQVAVAYPVHIVGICSHAVLARMM